MPLQQTSGNVTQDAYAGGKAAVPVYVESVFSTYLYTGTGSNQTITNNIDLADNGGMVWTKNRTTTGNNSLFDTVQGIYAYTSSNTTATEGYSSTTLRAFNNNGFGIGTNSLVNTSSQNYVSWTFRKQIKFFDIVNYIGTGSAHAINHNLGSVPGCIMIKDLNNTTNWTVYHSGLNNGSNPQNYYINLNTTGSQTSDSTVWNNTVPTSTQFTVGTSTNVNNGTNGNYIAYIFGAGGTGGFGLTGTQDIISCGSYTGTGASNNFISLGWEPQYLLIKRTDSTSSWNILDTMRGLGVGANWAQLNAETSGAEYDLATNPYLYPTATGFNILSNTGAFNASGGTYIYIAIRRGPMATPTTGTSVFSPNVEPNSSNPQTLTTGFPVDLSINASPSGSDRGVIDRLRGGGNSTSPTASNPILYTDLGSSEGAVSGLFFDNNTGLVDSGAYDSSGQTFWNFGRAPGFFDIVCYTGNATLGASYNHNLGVTPELFFIKKRSGSGGWVTYNKTIGNGGALVLNTNAAASYSNVFFNSTSPTSTTFTVDGSPGYSPVNSNGGTYVCYLFATLAGVSKVGSYTGNGTGQSIACNFGASGARFILIKRTDSTGDWYVFDSANGLTSSSSPYLLWDSTAAQTTGNNGVYASSGGFTLGSTASTTTNISSASYIFLAVS